MEWKLKSDKVHSLYIRGYWHVEYRVPHSVEHAPKVMNDTTGKSERT